MQYRIKNINSTATNNAFFEFDKLDLTSFGGRFEGFHDAKIVDVSSSIICISWDN